jgi:hypothetical protein
MGLLPYPTLCQSFSKPSIYKTEGLFLWLLFYDGFKYYTHIIYGPPLVGVHVVGGNKYNYE